MTSRPDFKPSQIFIKRTPPLTGVFNHTESEVAAAMLLMAMQEDDSWDGVLPRKVGETLRKHAATEGYDWLHNPFCRPDFETLCEEGFATGFAPGGSPIEFTEEGYKRMRNSCWWMGSGA